MTEPRAKIEAFVDWAWDGFTKTGGPHVLDRNAATAIDWATTTRSRHRRRPTRRVSHVAQQAALETVRLRDDDGRLDATFVPRAGVGGRRSWGWNASEPMRKVPLWMTAMPLGATVDDARTRAEAAVGRSAPTNRFSRARRCHAIGVTTTCPRGPILASRAQTSAGESKERLACAEPSVALRISRSDAQSRNSAYERIGAEAATDFERPRRRVERT